MTSLPALRPVSLADPRWPDCVFSDLGSRADPLGEGWAGARGVFFGFFLQKGGAGPAKVHRVGRDSSSHYASLFDNRRSVQNP